MSYSFLIALKMTITWIMIGEILQNFKFSNLATPLDTSSLDTRVRAMQVKQRRKRGRKGSCSHKPRYRTTWIRERRVEDRAKRRTCQNSNGSYIQYISRQMGEGRSFLLGLCEAKSEASRSRHLCRTRSIVAKRTMR